MAPHLPSSCEASPAGWTRSHLDSDPQSLPFHEHMLRRALGLHITFTMFTMFTLQRDPYGVLALIT
jgi:hypothetical protein